ncbi:hypothetical protein JCM10213v2_008355 [Rhodosporidiobolus nylandii]
MRFIASLFPFLALTSITVDAAPVTWYLAPTTTLSTLSSVATTSSSVGRAPRIPFNQRPVASTTSTTQRPSRTSFRDRLSLESVASASSVAAAAASSAAPVPSSRLSPSQISSLNSYSSALSKALETWWIGTPSVSAAATPTPTPLKKRAPYVQYGSPLFIPEYQPTEVVAKSYDLTACPDTDGQLATAKAATKDAWLTESFYSTHGSLSRFCGSTVQLRNPSNHDITATFTVVGGISSKDAPEAGVALAAGAAYGNSQIKGPNTGEDVEMAFPDFDL